MTTLEQTFKGLIYDRTFKYLFKDAIILKDFLDSYFKYINENKCVYFSKIEPQEIIFANNQKCKDYFGDIIAILNTNEIISLDYVHFLVM